MLIFMKLCCLFIMEVFAAVIFLEGILQWKQKEPVRFWSEEAAVEESRVKNVEIYNRVHGSLWIILGGVSMVSLIVNYLTGTAHPVSRFSAGSWSCFWYTRSHCFA